MRKCHKNNKKSHENNREYYKNDTGDTTKMIKKIIKDTIKWQKKRKKRKTSISIVLKNEKCNKKQQNNKNKPTLSSIVSTISSRLNVILEERK